MLVNASSSLVALSKARVRAYMRAKNLRRAPLAELAGLPESTIRFINRFDWNPTAETLDKLERVIPEDFQFDPKDGEVEPPPPAETTEETTTASDAA